MTKLASYLFAKGLEVIHGREAMLASQKDIDQKLTAFKNAYREAFNGQPITSEQRQKLNKSIHDFISNNDSNGV